MEASLAFYCVRLFARLSLIESCNVEKARNPLEARSLSPANKYLSRLSQTRQFSVFHLFA